MSQIPAPFPLTTDHTLVFTESRLKAVDGEHGNHLILEVHRDHTPLPDDVIVDEIRGLAFSIGNRLAATYAKENGYSGWRIEMNQGNLLTRANFHLHFKFVTPEAKVPRSVDWMVLNHPQPTSQTK